MKLLITADLHFEKLIMKNKDNCLSFIKTTIERERPEAFVIAGDTVDSHNLKSGSEEITELISFMKSLIRICKENKTKLFILRGTKGHDGEIMKNIYLSFKDSENGFIYIDETCIITERDIKIMFLPELYLSEYKDFIQLMNDVTQYKTNLPEIIIFHGMIDFAIPQLKQVDSNYNLSRSIVINSKDMREYTKLCAVGGHVHAPIQDKNIYYTDSMINSIGNTEMNKGLVLVDINPYTYNIRRIINPFNIIHKIVYLNFVERTMIEIDSEVQTLEKNYNLSEVIFRATINSNPEVLNNYTSFIKKYKPRYIKRIIQTSNDNPEIKTNMYTSKNKHVLSMEDIISMVSDISKNKYHKNIEQKEVNEILTINKKNS